jgi:ABC-type spermidine/putrescine transport system permease subunit II
VISLLTRNYRAHKFLLVVMLVFMYIPIGVLVIVSFNTDPYLLFPYEFTTGNYIEVFDGAYNDELANSLRIGFGSGLISMVVGAAAAWGVTRYRFPFRRAVIVIFVLPLVVPTLITGIGSSLLHDQVTGFSNSVNLAMITQSVRGSAFAFLIMMAQINQYPAELDDVAAAYGASLRQRFFEVTLPIIWGGLLGAFLIATIISFNDLNLTFFTIGSSSSIPTLTFNQMRYGLDASLFALSAVIAIFSVTLILSLSVLIEVSGLFNQTEN